MSFGSIIIAEHRKDKKDALHNCEVHLNLLKKVYYKEYPNVDYVLDVGIKLFEYKNTDETITFLFPFKFSADHVKDLADKFSTSKSIVNVIFNENILYKGNVNGKSYLNKYESTIGDLNEKQFRSFILYKLDSDDYECVSYNKGGYSGTKMTIKLGKAWLPDDDKMGNLYMRFRLLIEKKEQTWFKRNENLSNDVLQAAFSRTELYDIRINDKRETSDVVLDDIEQGEKNTLLPLKRVHFFFVTSVVDQVTNGTLEKMDTRMLESDMWGDYLPYKDKEHPRIAYQWTKMAKNNEAFDNFEIFFRNTCDNKNIRKILLYLFVAFWIGAVGSYIANIELSCTNIPWVLVLMTLLIVVYFLKRKA